MQIDLKELLTSNSIVIDNKVIIPEDYFVKSDLKELKNLKLTGKIYYSIDDKLILDLKLIGIMVLPDAYTLEQVLYPFEIKIDEAFDSFELKTMEIVKKGKNILDITDVLWQNIVLEIPISYSLNSKLEHEKGNGWEYFSNQEKKIDSRLAVLNELLENRKE